jgi:transposase
MAKPLMPDEVWNSIAPLLPPPRAKAKPGRPRVSDRACLTGILFVLKTGISWEDLPREVNCGSGMTCWRRLRDWQQGEIWHRLQRILLNRLDDAERIDWERAKARRATGRDRRPRRSSGQGVA